jgi:hypothetical protein
MKGNKEFILCAAIHDPKDIDMTGKPLIYCGWRHGNVLWQGKHVSRNLRHQGFLTSEGRFVDRKEGLKIAIESGQVENKTISESSQLFSEDLY